MDNNMSWRSMHYALRVEFLRKSKIIKSKKYKNTVEPMFVHELTKKIANNLKGWSVSLNILIRPFAEVQK